MSFVPAIVAATKLTDNDRNVNQINLCTPKQPWKDQGLIRKCWWLTDVLSLSSHPTFHCTHQFIFIAPQYIIDHLKQAVHYCYCHCDLPCRTASASGSLSYPLWSLWISFPFRTWGQLRRIWKMLPQCRDIALCTNIFFILKWINHPGVKSLLMWHLCIYIFVLPKPTTHWMKFNAIAIFDSYDM